MYNVLSDFNDIDFGLVRRLVKDIFFNYANLNEVSLLLIPNLLILHLILSYAIFVIYLLYKFFLFSNIYRGLRDEVLK